MTNPAEHERINAVMRAAFRSRRFTTDGAGRLLQGPAAETAPETESTEAAEPERLGSADGGAQGHVAEDPVAAVNAAIRKSRGRRTG
jgi:hypothetical protein